MPGRLLSFVNRRLPSVNGSSIDISNKKRSPASSSASFSSADSVKDHHLSGMDALRHKLSGAPATSEKKHHHHHHHHHHHILSLHSSSDGESESNRTSANRQQGPISVDMVVESPPLVFYGRADRSTGALFSSQLIVKVRDGTKKVDSITVRLLSTTTLKKTTEKHCNDCSVKVLELHRWDLTRGQSLQLSQGDNCFPISYLFPGNLATTTHNALCSIVYTLDVEIVPSISSEQQKSNPELAAYQQSKSTIAWKRELNLVRAILPYGTNSHLSVRIFPPTKLSANVTLPVVTYPSGEIPLSLVLTGIKNSRHHSTNHSSDIEFHWRLRRVFWRLEQVTHVLAAPCTKHANKQGPHSLLTGSLSTTATLTSKGLQYEQVSILAKGEVNSGWKTDLDAGKVEWETNLTLDPRVTPTCRTDGPYGLEVRHRVVLEMIVGEEWAPKHKVALANPTGTARILRTTFDIVMTERGGMGISWDEEQPPVYADVPASPPSYTANEALVADQLRSMGVTDFMPSSDIESFRLSSESIRSSTGPSDSDLPPYSPPPAHSQPSPRASDISLATTASASSSSSSVTSSVFSTPTNTSLSLPLPSNGEPSATSQQRRQLRSVFEEMDGEQEDRGEGSSSMGFESETEPEVTYGEVISS